MVQKTANDRHVAILDAAQKRFARFGLNKVTMEEIAADLGCSKAALYYYFTTKEDIFRQVLRREQQEFIDHLIESIRRDLPSSEKLELYFHHHLLLLNEMLNLKVLSIVPSDGNGFPIMRELFREFSAKESALLGEILEEGRSRGEFSITSPQTTATLLLHTLQGLRMRFAKSYHRGEIDESQITMAADELRMLGEIFVRGISRQGSGGVVTSAETDSGSD